MRVLITGASGFTAYYLEKLLVQEPACELYLTDRVKAGGKKIQCCDLTQNSSVDTLIEKIRPERIFHLAGSYTNNYETDYSVNVLCAKNILDALLKYKIKSRMLLIGSAAEYGFVKPEDNPVTENQPLQPSRIYGLTKVYQTYLMNFYCKVYNMDIVMARTFNLYGDGVKISKLLFPGRVAEQIEKIKKGELSKIMVGNLEAGRDYIDVQEAVKHYGKIMERGKSGEAYNVGSGNPVKMRDVLARILKEAGLDAGMVEERKLSGPDRTDISEIFADLSKINEL